MHTHTHTHTHTHARARLLNTLDILRWIFFLLGVCVFFLMVQSYHRQRLYTAEEAAAALGRCTYRPFYHLRLLQNEFDRVHSVFALKHTLL